jgi:hypothetical protein
MSSAGCAVKTRESASIQGVRIDYDWRSSVDPHTSA